MIISQVIAKAPHAFSHVSIGPTSACVGRIVEPGCMAKRLEVGQLTSASSAQVVVVPAAHEDPSGAPSMGTL